MSAQANVPQTMETIKSRGLHQDLQEDSPSRISKINFAIVTNTGKENVEFFKQKLPLLQRVKQWITREDTQLGKPHSQPYEEAKSRFWKQAQAQTIIGFENTLGGVRSLEKVTRCIYYVGLSKEDVYMINNFSQVK